MAEYLDSQLYKFRNNYFTFFLKTLRGF